MKKISKALFALVFCIITLFSITGLSASAVTPLDEIQKYEITVNIRPDGTMDIRYYISWKVLDDSSEGMLEWVKIGIPNSHVDTITPISNNIKSARYYNESGSFVRIDFDRSYERNEIVNFEFSIHQSYMFTVNDDSKTCRYVFTPGWFEEIEIKEMKVKWCDQNVLSSDSQKQEDGYLIWEDSNMEMGKRLTVKVEYDLESLTVDRQMQGEQEMPTKGGGAPSGNSDSSEGVWVLVIIIVVIAILLLIAYFSDYDDHSGFGGGYHGGYHSSCVRSSCVHSCACACACAGGGRAGCTKKDFYGTKHINMAELEKVLTEESDESNE